jgi:2-isopropylmalate synthase|nr:citramalate synthase [Vallitaleaceae bacterium]
LPSEIEDITKVVMSKVTTEVGIHCHNDSGVAVANTILAVNAGARQVQGTLIGIGERCGNADLSTVIANLQLKAGMECIPADQIEQLTPVARMIAEIANTAIPDGTPFVGKRAFTHKGGMHIDGVNKNSKSFEHVDPSEVGNERRFLMSEVSGRATVLNAIQKVAPEIEKTSPETNAIIQRLKELEHEGYQFEGAESTFELVIRKHLGKYKPFFELINFKTIGELPEKGELFSSFAMVKIAVEDTVKMTAAEGDGPVNALDIALREALTGFYPALEHVHLTDYKVRVLDSSSATAAKVRVLISSSDGKDIWTTVGVSTDIVEASLIALIDSIEYKLIKDLEKNMRAFM